MNDLVLQKNNLPTNIEELSRFALVGREKLASVRAEIRAIGKLKLANDVKEQKLQEAQNIAEIVLDAETKIGELLSDLPAKQGKRTDIELREGGQPKLETPKQQAKIEIGISDYQAKNYMKLAENKPIVEQAKAEAREKGEIITRQAVIDKAKEKEREHKQQTAISEQVKTSAESKSIDIYNSGKKYRVVYADPPWSYSDQCKNGGVQSRGASGVYPTMSLKEICELPVKNIAEDNAVLFLWVTSPLLEECFDVIRAWGFKYKSSFVWDKVKHNMGHYNSVRHEFLLICTRGSCVPDNNKLYDSVQSIERGEHSEKPVGFLNIIDDLYSYGNKLELFSRKIREGWDVWGNMV